MGYFSDHTADSWIILFNQRFDSSFLDPMFLTVMRFGLGTANYTSFEGYFKFFCHYLSLLILTILQQIFSRNLATSSARFKPVKAFDVARTMLIGVV